MADAQAEGEAHSRGGKCGLSALTRQPVRSLSPATADRLQDALNGHDDSAGLSLGLPPTRVGYRAP
jgi:hypothetical protein